MLRLIFAAMISMSTSRERGRSSYNPTFDTSTGGSRPGYGLNLTWLSSDQRGKRSQAADSAMGCLADMLGLWGYKDTTMALGSFL